MTKTPGTITSGTENNISPKDVPIRRGIQLDTKNFLYAIIVFYVIHIVIFIYYFITKIVDKIDDYTTNIFAKIFVFIIGIIAISSAYSPQIYYAYYKPFLYNNEGEDESNLKEPTWAQSALKIYIQNSFIALNIWYMYAGIQYWDNMVIG